MNNFISISGVYCNFLMSNISVIYFAFYSNPLFIWPNGANAEKRKQRHINNGKREKNHFGVVLKEEIENVFIGKGKGFPK